MYTRLITVIITFLSIQFSACEADIDLKNVSNEIALQPSLVLPLASVSVNFGQFLNAHYEGDNLDLSNNPEINYISKDSTEFQFGAPDFLENVQPLVKNLYPALAGEVTISPNAAIPPVTANDNVNLGLNSSANGDRIDSIKVTSVVMNVAINLTPDMRGINPSNLKFSVVLSPERVRMSGGGSNIITIVPNAFGEPVSVPVTDFTLITGGTSGFPIQLTIEAQNGSLPLVLSPASAITCNISFSNLVYSVAYGNFETAANVSFVHSRKLDIGKVFPDGVLKFSNPQLKIRGTTNIGTYLSFNIDYIKAFVSTDSSIPPVYAWFNGHTTNSVSDQFDTKPALPGLWVSKDFEPFDKDRGETNLLFENANKPDMIEYKFSGGINKTLVQKDPTPNFITPDGKLKVYFTYMIPFQLNKGSFYEHQDTIRNIISEIANVFDKYTEDRISSVAIVLDVKNGFPIKTRFSIQFMDFLGRKLLTDLAKEYTLEAENADVNGIVQPGNETNQTIVLLVLKDQIPELKKAAWMAYSVRFEGENNESGIHVTQFNTFDLKLGLYVKGDIKGSLGTTFK